MKLPRWLVVSLLSVSVSALLGYGVWWWVTWPERTFVAFVAHVASDELRPANELIVDVPGSWHLLGDASTGFDPSTIDALDFQLQKPTLLELFTAQRKFKGPEDCIFVACRGSVNGAGEFDSKFTFGSLTRRAPLRLLPDFQVRPAMPGQTMTVRPAIPGRTSP